MKRIVAVYYQGKKIVLGYYKNKKFDFCKYIYVFINDYLKLKDYIIASNALANYQDILEYLLKDSISKPIVEDPIIAVDINITILLKEFVQNHLLFEANIKNSYSDTNLLLKEQLNPFKKQEKILNINNSDRLIFADELIYILRKVVLGVLQINLLMDTIKSQTIQPKSSMVDAILSKELINSNNITPKSSIVDTTLFKELINSNNITPIDNLEIDEYNLLKEYLIDKIITKQFIIHPQIKEQLLDCQSIAITCRIIRKIIDENLFNSDIYSTVISDLIPHQLHDYMYTIDNANAAQPDQLYNNFIYESLQYSNIIGLIAQAVNNIIDEMLLLEDSIENQILAAQIYELTSHLMLNQYLEFVTHLINSQILNDNLKLRENLVSITENITNNTIINEYAGAKEQFTALAHAVNIAPIIISYFNLDETIQGNSAIAKVFTSLLLENLIRTDIEAEVDIAEKWAEQILNTLQVYRTYKATVDNSTLIVDVLTPSIATLNLTSNLTVNLYVQQSEDNGLKVDWGDGSNETIMTNTSGQTYATASHTYSAADIYELKVTPRKNSITWVLGSGDKSFLGTNSGKNASKSPELTNFIFGDGATIGGYSFCHCTELVSLNLPTDIFTIPQYCFYDCAKLASLNIYNNITTIEDYGCDSTKFVGLPPYIENIGDHGFYGNTLPTNCVFPATLKTPGTYAFASCKGIETVTIPETWTKLPTYLFQNCSTLTNVTFHNYLTSIGDSCFNSTNINNLTLPNSLTTIGNSSFSSTKITSLVIPNSVTSIGSSAFSSCKNLTSVTFPTTTEFSLGSSVFSGCTGFTSLVIPSNVTNLQYSAFQNCTNLVNIEIAAKNVGYTLFTGCSSIKKIWFSNPATTWTSISSEEYCLIGKLTTNSSNPPTLYFARSTQPNSYVRTYCYDKTVDGTTTTVYYQAVSYINQTTSPF